MQSLLAIFLVLSVTAVSVQGIDTPSWCWEPLYCPKRPSTAAQAPINGENMAQVVEAKYKMPQPVLFRGSQFWPSSTKTFKGIQGGSKQQQAPIIGN